MPSTVCLQKDFVRELSVCQPDLTKATRQVRDETLTVFYGSSTFVLTLFDISIDGAAIESWLQAIGAQSTSYLRRIKIIYRRKKTAKYIKKKLLSTMEQLGIRSATEGVVVATRLKCPFCYCEKCIMHIA